MRRAVITLLVAVVLAVGWPSAAVAHGQGHGELPLEQWQVLYAAAAILTVAWLAQRSVAPRPVRIAPGSGRPLPRSVDRVAAAGGVALRALGIVAFAVAVTAAWFGTDNARDNLAPALVYVVLWAGLPVLSAIVGDVWRALSPFDTLAAAASWVRRTVVGGDRGRTVDDDRPRAGLLWSHWPAAAGALAFTWLELCYHSPDEPRVLAVVITAYTVAVLAIAATVGRDWLREAEPLAAVFALFATLAPFFRDGDGRLRIRAPLSGLATLQVRAGTAALLCVLVTSAGFDGVRDTDWWRGVVDGRVGWGRTLVDTGGLLLVLAVVAVVWLGACVVTARATRRSVALVARWQAPALVVVALGYGIARYFTFFVVEVQGVIANVSDPYGEGWDLFGTATNVVRLDVVSASAAAWVLVAAVVLSHLGALWVATALADRDADQPTHGRAPFAVLLVASAVAGLALLL